MDKPKKSCPGEGHCLRQTRWTWIYSREGQCEHNCQPRKCPNFIFCGEVYPAYFHGCWGETCIYCDQTFGKKLIFEKKEKKEECPVCLEDKDLFIKLLNCDHFLCLVCYRQLHRDSFNFEGHDLTKDNIFPEPKVALKKSDYPPSPKDDSDQDDSDESDYENDPVQRKCPLCRTLVIPAWKQKMIDLGKIPKPDN